MRRLILGTAGHIDHGKTALVRALTGTDTDRLKEEKERGITIELGFAELDLPGAHFGVVDVPGHEAFVRAMVAGAAGMDLVMLVVAGDEGVMPQTREHLAIIELLGVDQLIVALTKCDTVEDEWLELVRADVEDVLSATPYAGATCIATSAVTGTGLNDLKAALADAATRVEATSADDLARVPLDRVFTIQGTGTVVTGTVWTGSLAKGDKVRILPADLGARIRGLQAHGREVAQVSAGDRSAVALTGDGSDRDVVARGATLVSSPAWQSTWMLTVRARLLPDTHWSLEHNQRVRVHVGTAEVLARTALLEPGPIKAGGEGWVQLRLEEPVLARARDRVVLRAYSPVTTFGGGVVAEPLPPKRNRLSSSDRKALDTVVDGEGGDCVLEVLSIAGWQGAPSIALPVLTGLPPGAIAMAMSSLLSKGALATATKSFSPGTVDKGREAVSACVLAEHAQDPLRPAVPLSVVRAAVPAWASSELADAIVETLCADGSLERHEGGIRRPDHKPELTPEQENVVSEIERLYEAGGLGPPLVDEFPATLAGRPDLWSLLKHLEGARRLVLVADGYYVLSPVIEAAIGRLRASLGGQTGLGPSDFRDVLPVTRKHLIPLLNHLDGIGATVRHDDGRGVPD